jgi:hypothetical protein
MSGPTCNNCNQPMTYMIDQHKIKDSFNFMKYEWFECKFCHNIVEIGASFVDTKFTPTLTDYECPRCHSKKNVMPSYPTSDIFCKICLTKVYPIKEIKP